MSRGRIEVGDDAFAPEMDPSTAFEVFFEVEFERVFGAAYLATGSRAGALDLSQRAFLRTSERWDRVLEMERPSLFTLRRAMNPIALSVRPSLATARSKLHGALKLEPFEDVDLDESSREALQSLRRHDRAVLALVLSLDLSAGETARVVGSRATRVRAELAEASATVRDRLQGRRNDADGTPPDTSDPVRSMLDEVRLSASPAPGAFRRHLLLRERTRRRRGWATAAAAIALVGVIGWGVTTGREAKEPSSPPATARLVAGVTLPAGTYRLPGLLFATSVTLPDGWRPGDSIWGPDGPGLAAVSTGPGGGSVSVAVFDLTTMSPIDPRTGLVRTLPSGARSDWYARFVPAFEDRVRRRLRAGAGDATRWRPVQPLAWLLAEAPGRVRVSSPVIAGREGSLASFTWSRPAVGLLANADGGTIELRPGVTYTFWAPARHESLAGEVLVGIAREAGTIPGTAEWGVIGSLSLKPY